MSYAVHHLADDGAGATSAPIEALFATWQGAATYSDSEHDRTHADYSITRETGPVTP